MLIRAWYVHIQFTAKKKASFANVSKILLRCIHCLILYKKAIKNIKKNPNSFYYCSDGVPAKQEKKIPSFGRSVDDNNCNNLNGSSQWSAP